jgi:hypothetical protein
MTTNGGAVGVEMTDQITLSRAQVGEIFKAINGISGILKAMPTPPPSEAAMHGIMYAIMSNLAVIRMTLADTPRVTSN